MAKQMRAPPVLSVRGRSLPQAWEKAYLEIAKKGMVYKRRDAKDSGDQLDCNMTIEVTNPDADPFSHLQGGTNAIDAPLLDYYMEMMGAKSGWLKKFSDPKDTRWDYMYHERLASYPESSGQPLDQIGFMIGKLIKDPSSRRTNAITWYPLRDMPAEHTPCLQRLWFTIIPGVDGQRDVLDMHYNFRSRNVMDASFGNMQGLYMVGCHIRDRVETATGRDLDMRMVENVDSYHVNSKAYPKFLPIAGRIKESIAKGETTADRCWNRQDVVQGLLSAREGVEMSIMMETEKNYRNTFADKVLGALKEYLPQGREEEIRRAMEPLSQEAITSRVEAESARVHGIGDRIFYLLDKYAPGNRK